MRRELLLISAGTAFLLAGSSLASAQIQSVNCKMAIPGTIEARLCVPVEAINLNPFADPDRQADRLSGRVTASSGKGTSSNAGDNGDIGDGDGGDNGTGGEVGEHPGHPGHPGHGWHGHPHGPGKPGNDRPHGKPHNGHPHSGEHSGDHPHGKPHKNEHPDHPRGKPGKNGPDKNGPGKGEPGKGWFGGHRDEPKQHHADGKPGQNKPEHHADNGWGQRHSKPEGGKPPMGGFPGPQGQQPGRDDNTNQQPDRHDQGGMIGRPDKGDKPGSTPDREDRGQKPGGSFSGDDKPSSQPDKPTSQPDKPSSQPDKPSSAPSRNDKNDKPGRTETSGPSENRNGPGHDGPSNGPQGDNKPSNVD